VTILIQAKQAETNIATRVLYILAAKGICIYGDLLASSLSNKRKERSLSRFLKRIYKDHESFLPQILSLFVLFNKFSGGDDEGLVVSECDAHDNEKFAKATQHS